MTTETVASPFGTFLDRLPAALYIVAHIAFLGVGIAVWMHAKTIGFPHAGALLLYATSQLVFFAYFAKWITFKMAVLAEQMLIFAMVVLLVS